MSDWRSVKNPPSFYTRVIIFKRETDDEAGYKDFGIYDCGRWLIGNGADACELKDPHLPTHWMLEPEDP